MALWRSGRMASAYSSTTPRSSSGPGSALALRIWSRPTRAVSIAGLSGTAMASRPTKRSRPAGPAFHPGCDNAGMITNPYYRAWRERNTERFRQLNRGYKDKRNRERPAEAMWAKAKTRAARRGIKFTITPADIKIVTHCPILGTRLTFSGSGPSRATLDRIVNSRGYVPGNVGVISYRANTLKSNLTRKQLEGLLRWVTKAS